MNLSFMSAIVLIFTLLAPGCSPGGDHRTFMDFYEKYKKADEFVSFSVSPGLIGLFGDEAEEPKQSLKNLKDVKILIYKGGPASSQYFVGQLKKDLSPRLYDDLMVIGDGNDAVEFKIRKQAGKVSELIMIVKGSDSLVIGCIEGEIAMDKVKEFCKKIDTNGMKYLNDT